MTAVIRAVRCLLGLSFLAAALAKLLHPGAVQHAAFGIGSDWTEAAAVGIDTALGVVLIFDPSRLPAAIAIAVSLAYSALLVVRARDEGWLASCGCFGELWPSSIKVAVVRNAIILVTAGGLLLFAYRAERSRGELDAGSRAGSTLRRSGARR